ncbi:PEGA domain-containing protein [Candidatus Neomarinimicrobiota bacterium]
MLFNHRPRPVLSILVLVFGLWATLPAQEREGLAIIDFDGFGISTQEASVLTNRLSTYLVQAGVYRIIERGQMKQILEEQDFQMTGCTSDECAVEIGQLLGAQLILAGSFGKIGSTYTIDMRIIDVTTGGIIQTASHDVRGEIDDVLTSGLSEAARKLTGGAAVEAAPAPISVPTPSPAMVNVTSEPAGARVVIDNMTAGETPLSQFELEPLQRHEITILMEGYTRVDTPVYAEAGQQLRLNIPLEQIKDWLAFDGDAGARIALDGNVLGKLPLDRMLVPVGGHNVVVTKPEYFSYRTEVEVRENSEAVVRFQLNPKPRTPALVLSAVIPGGGQLYQGYRAKGLAFLASAVVAGTMAFSQQSSFTEQRDEYDVRLEEYQQATTSEEIETRRAEVNTAFDAMKDAERSRNIFAGVLGVVWVVNLVEIRF